MNEGIGTDGMAGNDHYRMTVDLNVLDRARPKSPGESLA